MINLKEDMYVESAQDASFGLTSTICNCRESKWEVWLRSQCHSKERYLLPLFKGVRTECSRQALSVSEDVCARHLHLLLRAASSWPGVTGTPRLSLSFF